MVRDVSRSGFGAIFAAWFFVVARVLMIVIYKRCSVHLHLYKYLFDVAPKRFFTEGIDISIPRSLFSCSTNKGYSLDVRSYLANEMDLSYSQACCKIKSNYCGMHQ